MCRGWYLRTIPCMHALPAGMHIVYHARTTGNSGIKTIKNPVLQATNRGRIQRSSRSCWIQHLRRCERRNTRYIYILHPMRRRKHLNVIWRNGFVRIIKASGPALAFAILSSMQFWTEHAQHHTLPHAAGSRSHAGSLFSYPCKTICFFFERVKLPRPSRKGWLWCSGTPGTHFTDVGMLHMPT